MSGSPECSAFLGTAIAPNEAAFDPLVWHVHRVGLES